MRTAYLDDSRGHREPEKVFEKRRRLTPNSGHYELASPDAVRHAGIWAWS